MPTVSRKGFILGTSLYLADKLGIPQQVFNAAEYQAGLSTEPSAFTQYLNLVSPRPAERFRSSPLKDIKFAITDPSKTYTVETFGHSNMLPEWKENSPEVNPQNGQRAEVEKIIREKSIEDIFLEEMRSKHFCTWDGPHNFAISGATTAGVRELQVPKAAEEVSRENPAIVFLGVGGNDFRSSVDTESEAVKMQRASDRFARWRWKSFIEQDPRKSFQTAGELTENVAGVLEEYDRILHEEFLTNYAPLLEEIADMGNVVHMFILTEPDPDDIALLGLGKMNNVRRFYRHDNPYINLFLHNASVLLNNAIEDEASKFAAKYKGKIGVSLIDMFDAKRNYFGQDEHLTQQGIVETVKKILLLVKPPPVQGRPPDYNPDRQAA